MVLAARVVCIWVIFALFFDPQGLKIIIIPYALGSQDQILQTLLKQAKLSIIVEIGAQIIQLSISIP